jgi:hypothetical protein
LKISKIINKISQKKKAQPNSFSCWERNMMSVPKSKNPKNKNKHKNKNLQH